METYVFVYGTLKRGLYNYETYLQPAMALGKATFIGVARTTHAEFHMVLNDDVFYPCLYRAPTNGYQVPGEVYLVDADTLAALDILEEVNDSLYARDVDEVHVDRERKGETISCQTYLMPIFDDLPKLEQIADYTPEMNAKYDALMGAPSSRSSSASMGRRPSTPWRPSWTRGWSSLTPGGWSLGNERSRVEPAEVESVDVAHFGGCAGDCM